MVALILAFVASAFADGASSETRAGHNYFEESIAGRLERDDWMGKLGVSILKTTFQAANSTQISDQTNSLNGEADYDPSSGFGGGLQLDGSKTPAENLTNVSFVANASYRWKFRHDHRALKLSVQGGVSRYTQTLTSQTKKRNGKIVSADSSTGIQQTDLGLLVNSRFSKNWSVSVGFDVYGYNKSVGQFESQLDSPAAILRGAGAFASTLGGLAKYSSLLELTYDFLKTWSADGSITYGSLALDGSISTLSSFRFETTQIEDWTLSLGFEALHSNIYSANYAVFRVEFDF